MKREQLITKLNWFYSFELNQVDLYTAQSKAEDDTYIALAFRRVAAIEQQHVDNLAALLKNFDTNPTVLGDLLSPLIGRLAGSVLSLAGTVNVLKADIRLEEKAMEDYTALIRAIEGRYDRTVVDTLAGNLIDEDLHTAWFVKQLAARGVRV